MTDTQLLAGVARSTITPPKGIFLIGYGDRSKGNRGVHDDLTATVLILVSGETRVALVALDLLAINEFVVDRVRARIEDGTEVLLCCSHTHSGPIVFADDKSARRNQRYIDSLIENIVAVIAQAGQELSPARLDWSQGEAEIAINRRERQPDGSFKIGRNPEGPVDRSLQVVSVIVTEHAQQKRLATLVNFACHGTVLGPDNLLASADWIGAMRARVEQGLGGLTLFLQGATANLNPDMYWEDPRALEMVAEQGQTVAEAVLSAVRQEARPIRATPFGLERRETWLPLEASVTSLRPPKNYAKPLLSMAHLPGWLAFLADPLLKQRYPWKPRIEARDGYWQVPMRINVVRLGDLALVTYGAEVFTEIGQKVKANSPASYTLFASVTDGCISYLHTVDSHTEGGYEVDLAPLAYRYPGRLQAHCEAIAIRTSQEMLNELWMEKVESKRTSE